MTDETKLTNFAIWLQAVHGKELGLKDNTDARLRELAGRWLEFSNERYPTESFPCYDAATNTCYYCFDVVTDKNCNTWHCHNCGFYTLQSSNYCENCLAPKPKIA